MVRPMTVIDDHSLRGRACRSWTSRCWSSCSPGWIDASGAAAAAMAALEKECAATVARRLRRRHLHRLPRPPARCSSCATASAPGSSGRSPSCASATTPTAATCCCSAGPSRTWRGTASPSTVADLAEQLGVAKMAALGAYPFATPHTRPPHLSATSPSAEVLAELPFRTSSVDVPAGMAAALEQAVQDRGIPALGIWAQVPHYVSSMSYPAASVALLEGLTTATGITISASELRRESVLQRERLDQLVDGNDEHRAMVAQFERLYDAAEEAESEAARAEDATPDGGAEVGEIELRSGDELAGRGRALPARPGQELTRVARRRLAAPRRSTVVGHEGRRRHRKPVGQGRRAGRRPREAPGTRAAGRPRPATIRSCRCCSPPSTRRSSSSARRSPWPSPATR